MNIMTNAMEKVTNMLLESDSKFKKYGTEPYGIRELTEKEQRERFENLTPQELKAMVDQYGPDEVNAWLQKFWKEDNYGG